MEKQAINRTLSEEDIEIYMEDLGWKYPGLDYKIECNFNSKKDLLEIADKIRFSDEIIKRYEKLIPNTFFSKFYNHNEKQSLYIRANRVKSSKDLELICDAFSELRGIKWNKGSIPDVRTAKHYLQTRYPGKIEDLTPYENMVFPLTKLERDNFEIPKGELLYGFFWEPWFVRNCYSTGYLFQSNKILSFGEFEELAKKHMKHKSDIAYPDEPTPELFEFAKDLEAYKFWRHSERLSTKKVPSHIQKASKNGELMYSPKTKNYILCASYTLGVD